MQSTLNDVARQSGYSKTSVFFAFNDPSQIFFSAKTGVFAAADELGCYPDPVAGHLSMQRVSGYNLDLYAEDLPDIDSWTVHVLHPPATRERGYTTPRTLLVECPAITAMVYIACRELNFSIPEDVSVVGVDLIPENRALRPSMTAVPNLDSEKKLNGCQGTA